MSDSLRYRAPVAVEYPDSDGRPMGETPVHRDCIIDALGALREYFIERPEVYVGADMFVYYEEGNPRASVVPDVFVVFGAVKDEQREGGWRETYKVWEEGKGPDLVLEVTSGSTRRADQVGKRALYGRLGVREYFLYDPREEYLVPPLVGMRLGGGEYERLGTERMGDGTEGVWSEVLGLYLCHRGRGRLRLHDPSVGRDLVTPWEQPAARRAAEARVAEAEARVAELEALLSSARDGHGGP